MATFLLIRHAAHGDVGRRLSGRIAGLELSDDGIAQSNALAEQLAAERLTAIRCSPLERTVATAEAIARSHGLSVEIGEALNEIDFGTWAGREFCSLSDDPLWVRWNAERATAATPGGEYMADAQRRITAALEAMAESEPEGRIAIVTHCDMIRAVVCDVLGMSLDHLLRFDVDPGSVTRVTVADGEWRLLSLNEGVYR